MTEHIRRESPGLLWAASALTVVAATAVMVAPTFAVVAGRVVTSAGAGAILVLAACVLVVTHWARGRARASGSGKVTRAVGGRVATALMLIALAAFGLVGGLQFLFGGRYYLLDPAGPDGCRVVVNERDGWPLGVGWIYAVRGFADVQQVGRYSGDDGYGPMADGNYDFSVEDGVATLTVRSGWQPVWPEEPFRIACT